MSYDPQAPTQTLAKAPAGSFKGGGGGEDWETLGLGRIPWKGGFVSNLLIS